MVACYHMIAFTDFIIDPETQFVMGYSFIGLIIIVVAINVSIVVVKQYNKF